MAQEEKAKRYDEAIERAKAFNNGEDVNIEAGTTLCEYIFPELKESEDEKVEKAIFGMVYDSDNELWSSYDVSKSDVLTWLVRQGEQELNDDEDILQRFSFYSYKDEPNILYLSELHVNSEYRNKGIGTKILTIADKVAVDMCCNFIRLKTKIGSNAERLYRRNGYTTLKKEDNQVWLEKQGGRME